VVVSIEVVVVGDLMGEEEDSGEVEVEAMEIHGMCFVGFVLSLN